MSLSPPPVRDPVTAPTWLLWFQAIYRLLGAQASGPTSNRPTQRLAIGQQYLDTTLGKPVWWQGAHWIDATGSSV